MDMFSNFCNICYKTNDRSLKNISQENVEHLKDTLFTFIGYVDIINDNIYLCQLCCEELTRCNKFREMCFTNLMQLRQRVFDMKSKLELENETCAVENTLQIFLHNIIRRSILGKNNHPVLIPSEYHKNIKSSVDMNKSDSIINKQIINLQSERNECKFAGDCSSLTVMNNPVECYEYQLAVTNKEVDMNNDNMLRYSEGSTMIKFETESNENNSNVTDLTRKEFIVKNEMEINASQNSTVTNFEHGNLDVVPAASNLAGIESTKEIKQENIAPEYVELQTIHGEFGVRQNAAFAVPTFCTFVNIESCGPNSITDQENAVDDMKLRSRDCTNKSAAAIMNTQHRDAICPTGLQSNAHKHVYPGAEPHTSTVSKSFTTSMADKGRVYNNPPIDSTTLTKHKRVRSTEKRYKCTDCPKAFTQSTNLHRHERTHTGEKPYKCTTCNKAFIQASDLTIHERIHSGAKPYKCTLCDKTFRQIGCLIKHKRSHSGDKPYKCSVCNKTFTDSSKLIRHERVHSGVRPYQCTVCDKAFAQSSDLTAHERTHSGARPYKCGVCNTGFAQKGSLTKHERTHSGDRPYLCTVCNRTFTNSSALIKHKRIHSGDRPYKCSFCSRAFIDSSTLTVHERTHTGQRPYECSVCNKKFIKSSNLTSHARVHRVHSSYE